MFLLILKLRNVMFLLLGVKLLKTVLKNRDSLIQLRGDKSRMKVAKDLDITPQMLGAIERGGRNPSLQLAKKIASYYEVSVEQIF